MAAESRALLYSMSFAYFYGALIFAIPPGRPYTSLEKLMFPFRYKIWTCICALFTVAAIVVVLLKCGPRKRRDFIVGKFNNMPFFNMINILFGGSISFNRIPIRNFARTILLIWLFSSLVLRNAYQGKLFDNLRSDQRMAPLYEFKDLYESDLNLYLLESFYRDFVDSYPQYKHR